MMQQQPLLEQLNDINELDQVAKWPLGLGWWVVIGILSLVVFIFLVWVVKRSLYKKTWKYKACLELKLMQKQLKTTGLSDNTTGKIYLNQFNHLLRKIVIHKCTRNECAHLTGDKWLQWLSNNDPKKYNWLQHKDLLINLPYSNKIADLDSNEFRNMINALKKWVK